MDAGFDRIKQSHWKNEVRSLMSSPAVSADRLKDARERLTQLVKPSNVQREHRIGLFCYIMERDQHGNVKCIRQKSCQDESASHSKIELSIDLTSIFEQTGCRVLHSATPSTSGAHICFVVGHEANERKIMVILRVSDGTMFRPFDDPVSSHVVWENDREALLFLSVSHTGRRDVCRIVEFGPNGYTMRKLLSSSDSSVQLGFTGGGGGLHPLIRWRGENEVRTYMLARGTASECEAVEVKTLEENEGPTRYFAQQGNCIVGAVHEATQERIVCWTFSQEGEAMSGGGTVLAQIQNSGWRTVSAILVRCGVVVTRVNEGQQEVRLFRGGKGDSDILLGPGDGRKWDLMGISADRNILTFQELSFVNRPCVIEVCLSETSHTTIVKEMTSSSLDDTLGQVSIYHDVLCSTQGDMSSATVLSKPGLEGKHATGVLVHSYGAYGVEIGPHFNPVWLALLNAGWVIYMLHLGASRREVISRDSQSSLQKKFQQVDGYLACLDEIRRRHPGIGLSLETASAGAIVVGNALNHLEESQCVNKVLLHAPFLDLLGVMGLENGWLVESERGEWGAEEDLAMMRALSPLEGVRNHAYPDALVVLPLADERVSPLGTLKWVHRVRAQPSAGSLGVLVLPLPDVGHHGRRTADGDIEVQAIELAWLLFDKTGRRTR